MLDKYFLLNKIVNILKKNQFNTFVTSGCFDIAAKREFLILIKTLLNVDALNSEQSLSLRAVSHFLSAYPFVISMRNNREFLNDEIVYSRFELPVITPKLFEEMIEEEEIYVVESSKGRHTTNIDVFSLREKRKELGYTMQELAQHVGISKKALYEIENKRVNPTEETVEKLESLLGVKFKLPFEMKAAKETYLKPENEFQEKVSKEFSRMGIDNSSVYSAPFEIVGRERFSLITNLSKNTVKIKREASIVRRLSDIFSSKAIFIAKRSHEKIVEGIPVFLESQLPEIESSRELEGIISEKEY
jgi:putative transcriptional regulator